MKKILAGAALVGATMMATSGIAFAGEVPNGDTPPANSDGCMQLLNEALPLLDPTTKLKIALCQDPKK